MCKQGLMFDNMVMDAGDRMGVAHVDVAMDLGGANDGGDVGGYDQEVAITGNPECIRIDNLKGRVESLRARERRVTQTLECERRGK